MRRKRTMRLGYQAAVCGLCRGPIDFPSGFWFDTEAELGIVHPSCMAYRLERGSVVAGDKIDTTCGNTLCVRPDHLIRIHVQETCRQDGRARPPHAAIACTPDDDVHEWWFDHFHAILDGKACPCRHETVSEARQAHGQPAAD